MPAHTDMDALASSTTSSHDTRITLCTLTKTADLSDRDFIVLYSVSQKSTPNFLQYFHLW